MGNAVGGPDLINGRSTCQVLRNLSFKKKKSVCIAFYTPCLKALPTLFPLITGLKPFQVPIELHPVVCSALKLNQSQEPSLPSHVPINQVERSNYIKGLAQGHKIVQHLSMSSVSDYTLKMLNPAFFMLNQVF